MTAPFKCVSSCTRSYVCVCVNVCTYGLDNGDDRYERGSTSNNVHNIIIHIISAMIASAMKRRYYIKYGACVALRPPLRSALIACFRDAMRWLVCVRTDV